MPKQELIKRLKEIIMVAREYEIDAQSQIDGYDYLIADVEDLLKEIKAYGIEIVEHPTPVVGDDGRPCEPREDRNQDRPAVFSRD